MKGLICEAYGAVNDLKYGELEKPVPREDEVLIEVKYCGVNFPDTLIVRGLYQFRPQLPFAPGGEVAGVVAAVGAGVHEYQTGDKVLAAMGWGGFAQFAIAKASNTFKIPDGVTFKTASTLLETYATAIHALKDRGNLLAGEKLVVLGAAGGTGTAAVQLGKALGAHVIACASSDEKLDFCRKQGADELFNSQKNDLKEELKSIGGVDVVFDPVGGELSEKAFRSLKPGGRHLIVGFASGQIPAIPWNLPLLKSASIVGVFWGHFWRNQPKQNAENVQDLLGLLEQGKISPAISKSYLLEEGVSALNDLLNRNVKGKVVLEV